MHDVVVSGIGYTPVREHWHISMRELAVEAIQAALRDAALSPNDLDAVITGNAPGGPGNNQNNPGALLADYAGLRGIEAFRVEAADASGGIAVRQGYLMIKSGEARHVLVLGIEKITDTVGAARTSGLSSYTDVDYEAAQGATPTALAAMLMRRYMHEYNLQLEDFEGFSINAHARGSTNPAAMFRNILKPGKFATAPVVAPPVNLFDSAPEGDGAAALILSAADNAESAVRISGSATATDSLAVHERQSLLFLQAVNIAAGKAFAAAHKTPADIHVLELHDSSTILSTLQLEAAGFAGTGTGWNLANPEIIGLNGKLPISTFGGLKARGHVPGATGVYQVAEIVQQLREEAGDNQVPGATTGMAINLGSTGGTAVVHILEKR